MKDYKITYRFAVGYGANLRYIGMRRTYIVSAPDAETAKTIVSAYTGTTFGTGLHRGWIRTVSLYKGGKLTRTATDLRPLTKGANV